MQKLNLIIFKNDMLKNKNGFTLIEILVAITVLSLLMISVYELVDNSSRTKDQILKEDRIYLQIHSALDRFALDWSQVYTPLFHSIAYKAPSPDDENTSPQDPNFNANPNITSNLSANFPQMTEKEIMVPALDDPKKGVLIFMSTSGRRVFENSKQSRYIWVRYSLRNSTADPSEEDENLKDAPLELVRSTIKTNIYRKEFDWEAVPKYILLRGIKDLRFMFWNRETKKYVDSLKELNKDKSTPRIMKIKLTIINSSGVEEIIERSYKPIWPYFDVAAAEKEKKDNKKKSGSSKGEAGGI
jgi:prepilin-type N-terminal cleavage/methylation domain-containing protein